MRRVLILVIPTLLLVGLILIQRTLPTWQNSVVNGAPGTVLYAATFDGDAQGIFNNDWEQSSGRLNAAIADGAMRIALGDNANGASIFSVTETHFADFDLRVQARATGGPEDNSYGVIFRFQDHGNSNFRDDDSYVFLISSDGYYRVLRTVSGVEKSLSDWIESPLINLGINAVNSLRIRAEGNTFQFFINGTRVELCIPNNPDGESTFSRGECVGGTMVEVLHDDSIASGRLGVGAINTTDTDAGNEVTVEFDNLVVVAPSADGDGEPA